MSSPVPVEVVPEVEEFSAFLARYHTDAALRRVHFARVVMGGIGALAVVSFNLLRLADVGGDAEASVIRIATMVCGVHVLACLVTLLLTRRWLLADLRRQAESLRDRAWQVAQFVHRRGNILLVLAATGHGLVLIGTEFKLRLFAADGGVLLVALVPTVLLLLHGFIQVPTRARLCELYARLTSQPITRA